MVLSVDDGNLKIGNVKRNPHSSATSKPPRTVQELPLKELQGEGARLVQLFHSGLMKLPKSIRNLEAGAFKACGHTFRQYLDRNATWQSLKASNPELTPYSLRHGYALRAAKYYPQPLPLLDTAKLMGHDLKTHIRHYGQWSDHASTKSAVEASIQSLEGASQASVSSRCSNSSSQQLVPDHTSIAGEPRPALSQFPALTKWISKARAAKT